MHRSVQNRYAVLAFGTFTSNLLVSMTAVNAELYMKLNCFVRIGRSSYRHLAYLGS